ncbi:hypothetical protein MLD38_032932 [Melastoma candidum]|uniref:Uncharacterized protein n=1 Tax=Melastoma candidum TaxID=119954 RepID=A0ACB9M8U9_9MYRT|nr:hypothetical protein MLD38_032932 [Melastoma candidum]
MDWSSWFRKTLLKDSSKAAATSTADPTTAKDPPQPSKKQPRLKLSDLEEYGITDKLVDFVSAFTVDTFKSFPLQDGDEPGRDIESGATAEGNHKRDLSEWQEKHATLALARVKELAQLRYVLCPRQMKELRFWQIYFMLVRSHVAEYELRAIKLARLNEMKNEGGKTTASSWIFLLELAEPIITYAKLEDFLLAS